ncbi:hypothetical protein LEL_10856 [Akanthomyces lecanii RCEF 1005]|uniref:Uncharacterized protein n=1 Tax=Akanthomyces lecanii RCEF 1005 TaxID=1081108 RepID=A0A167S4V0_CORDF|nr:hypothetical protein LEL_10856 [Akanthomyces lecanii RCEF 1005]
MKFDQPLKSRFRLLGTGSLSLQSDRPPRLTLCDTCWLFHTHTACQKPKVCGNCGSRRHDLEGCRAVTKCVGCHGPHDTGFPQCFALPKHDANGCQALSRTERNYAIQQGKAAYERWERSQQRSVEKTQVPTTDQVAPDAEMTEAGKSTSTITEPQNHASIPEDDNVGNSEESDLSEGSIEIDGEAEEDDEEGREENEKQNITSQPQAVKATSVTTAKQSAVKAAVLRRVQANVDNSEPAHHAALQLAYEKTTTLFYYKSHTLHTMRKETCAECRTTLATSASPPSPTGTLEQSAYGCSPTSGSSATYNQSNSRYPRPNKAVTQHR